MNPQTIFIIDKKKKVLIFLGFLDEQQLMSQEELSYILGYIISESTKLKLDSFSTAQIKDKNYFFGNFDKIVIAIQYANDDSSLEDFLI